MNLSHWIYPAVGALTVAVLAACDGVSGAKSGILAWVIAGGPIVFGRVAEKVRLRKTPANRNRMAFMIGVVPRLGWTLGAAGCSALIAGDQLSPGFWPALLVFYQVALLVIVRSAIPPT